MSRFEVLITRSKTESYAKLIGAVLTSISDGTSTWEMPITEALLIPEGFVQGGAIASLADFAGVYAAMTKIENGHTPASQFIANFFRPVTMQDGKLIAHAVVDNESTRFIWVTINIFSSCTKIKSKVSAIYVKL